MIETEEYLRKIRLNAAIYSDKITKCLENEEFQKYIISKEFIESLYAFISANTLLDIVDEYTKDNILNILIYVRSHTKEYTNEINEIIASLNSSKGYATNEFYQRQYLKRSGCYNQNYRNYFQPNFFEENPRIKKLIRRSLTLDYDNIIQIINSNDCEINELVRTKLFNNYILNTFNSMLYDCPSLLDNEDFNRKVKLILKETRKISFDMNKNNNKTECIKLNLEAVYRTHKILKRIKNR